MKNIIFSNIEAIEPDKNYMIFLGKDISYMETLGRYFQDKGYTPLVVTPEIALAYPKNTVVVNPILSEMGHNHHFPRLNPYEFDREVSENPFIASIIERILDNQNELIINPFRQTPELTLDENERVSVIAPNPQLFQTLKGKVSQRKLFSGHIPMPGGEITDLGGLYGLFETYNQGEGVFITCETGHGCSGQAHITDKDKIYKIFKEDQEYVIATWVPGVVSIPCAQGLVANDGEVITFSVAGQKICGTKFMGTVYPANLTPQTTEEIKEHNKTVGLIMAKMGYRGMYGTDYVVDSGGNVYYCEANVRKNGSTIDIWNMMELTRPKECEPLPIMEMIAVREGRLANDVWDPPEGMFWEMEKYTYKGKQLVDVVRELPETASEFDIFSRGGTAFLNRLAEGTIVHRGGILSKIVVVGTSKDEVSKNMDLAKSIVDDSISYGDVQSIA